MVCVSGQYIAVVLVGTLERGEDSEWLTGTHTKGVSWQERYDPLQNLVTSIKSWPFLNPNFLSSVIWGMQVINKSTTEIRVGLSFNFGS